MLEFGWLSGTKSGEEVSDDELSFEPELFRRIHRGWMYLDLLRRNPYHLGLGGKSKSFSKIPGIKSLERR